MAEGKIPQNGGSLDSQQNVSLLKEETKSQGALQRNKRNKGDEEESCKRLVGRKKKPPTRQLIVTQRRRLQCHIHSIASSELCASGFHLSCCCGAPITIQEADPKTVRHHRVLSRIADTITTWDEITSLGLELNCNPNDVARLKSENRSIKGAAYEILRSFYTRNINSDKSMEAFLGDVFTELGKGAIVLNLGLEELNSDVN